MKPYGRFAFKLEDFIHCVPLTKIAVIFPIYELKCEYITENQHLFGVVNVEGRSKYRNNVRVDPKQLQDISAVQVFYNGK